MQSTNTGLNTFGSIIVVTFSRTKIYLIETIILSIVTIFLNYSISKNVDKVSKIEIVGSTIRGSTNSRYLTKL